MTTFEKTEALRKIKDEILAMKGSLADERRENKVFPVIGEGSHDARIMFVGEAPGKNEAATGRPFAGAAGRVLDELLLSVGIPREKVYITNIVKDRPTDNRDPNPEEIELYAPFLDRQIEILKPKVIATLGRFSMQYVMQRYGLGHELRSISQIRGKLFETIIADEKISILPLLHPAVALYGTSKTLLLEDFKILKKLHGSTQ